MVNLDQAQKNVRNAQDQLDQALKELEKAKRPKVWEREFPTGGHFYRSFQMVPELSADYPCKVTVRPLGGPEPWTKDCMVSGNSAGVQVNLHVYDCGPFSHGDKVRVTVERL